MIPSNELCEEVPLKIVGSNLYGRYPNISVEQTYNMIISDGRLVDYAGFKNVTAQNTVTKLPSPINPNGVGRGEYRSTKLNKVIAVVYNGVYLITPNITISLIGTLNTFTGDVFIAEDFQGNIAICDKSQIWIYNPSLTPAFFLATLNGTNPIDFTPGYVAYHNGRFLSVDLASSTWRLSDPSNGNSQFPNTSQFVGGFQTKADIPTVISPLPGRGNLIVILGSNVGEFWNSSPTSALFPYIKSTAVNLDYGTASADSFAVSTEYCAWLAGNSQSGLFIAYSNGGTPTKISTDGIDFLLGTLTAPQDSHGFFFRQDGHLIYQLTFKTDNITLAFDFNTQKFFSLCDQNMNYHPAKKAVYFNNTYYFVSLNDGNFYQFDTSITNYNYGYNSHSQYIVEEIPRIRLAETFRKKDNSIFIGNGLSILFESGFQPDPGMSVARIELTDPGEGYTEANVYLVGGEGQGATASLSIGGGFSLLNGQDFNLLNGQRFELLDSDGAIEEIIITNPGTGYITPPTVIIDGDGTGAAALAFLTINTLPRADLSISWNGGESFGNYVPITLNTMGHYLNRFTYFDGLGAGNQLTPQLRLWSKGRFVVGDGELTIYQ